MTCITLGVLSLLYVLEGPPRRAEAAEREGPPRRAEAAEREGPPEAAGG